MGLRAVQIKGGDHLDARLARVRAGKGSASGCGIDLYGGSAVGGVIAGRLFDRPGVFDRVHAVD